MVDSDSVVFLPSPALVVPKRIGDFICVEGAPDIGISEVKERSV